MANTRAGSAVRVGLRHGTAGAYTTVAAPGIVSGYTGLDVSYDPSQYSFSGGGFSGSRNSGTVVGTGSMGIGETENTLQLLLGRNGARIHYEVQWATGITDQFEACTTISRSFNERGDRRFDISFTIDGTVTRV